MDTAHSLACWDELGDGNTCPPHPNLAIKPAYSPPLLRVIFSTIARPKKSTGMEVAQPMSNPR